MKQIRILAHRGYLVNGEPENSIPAFQTAIHHKADGIELDVHITSDRKFICYHDFNLEKIGSSDTIKDLSMKEITSIELMEDITIPSLEEVFDLFGNKIVLNIELKSQKTHGKELVDLIHQFDLTNDLSKLIVSSFVHQHLEEIKMIDSEIPTGLLCYSSKNQVQTAKKLHCEAFHPFYDSVPKKWLKFRSLKITNKLHEYYTHKSFDEAKSLGLLIHPWVVNSEKYLKKAIMKQVDGIITDDVEKAVNLIDQFS